jgi:hypothetical protein
VETTESVGATVKTDLDGASHLAMEFAPLKVTAMKTIHALGNATHIDLISSPLYF